MAECLWGWLGMSIPAVLFEPIDSNAAPAGAVGIITARDSDKVVCYAIRCPGCRTMSALMLTDRDGHPFWTVTAGNAQQPEAVTLSPSVHHTKEGGGCGWHGWLRNGQWEEC